MGRVLANGMLLVLIGGAMLVGCGTRQGMAYSARVTLPDGTPVSDGEIWLEPNEAALAHIRPAREAIIDGEVRFPATAGLRPGRWIARLSPPPLGSLSTSEDIARSFEHLHVEIVIPEAGEPGQASDFVVTPRSAPATTPPPR